jgi:hypothetical protein
MVVNPIPHSASDPPLHQPLFNTLHPLFILTWDDPITRFARDPPPPEGLRRHYFARPSLDSLLIFVNTRGRPPIQLLTLPVLHVTIHSALPPLGKGTRGTSTLRQPSLPAHSPPAQPINLSSRRANSPCRYKGSFHTFPHLRFHSYGESGFPLSPH